MVIHSNCETHTDIPAIKRIIGECDSFGHEESYVCHQCLDEYIATLKNNPISGHCDFCHVYQHHLTPKRDTEEGVNGPVYYICNPCSIKLHQQCFGSD